MLSIVTLEVDLLLVNAAPEDMCLKLLDKDGFLREWFASDDVACCHDMLARQLDSLGSEID